MEFSATRLARWASHDANGGRKRHRLPLAGGWPQRIWARCCHVTAQRIQGAKPTGPGVRAKPSPANARTALASTQSSTLRRMRKVPVGTTLVPPNNVRLSRLAEAKPLAHPVRRGHRGSPDQNYQLRMSHRAARLWMRQRRIPSDKPFRCRGRPQSDALPLQQHIAAAHRSILTVSNGLPTGSQRAPNGLRAVQLSNDGGSSSRAWAREE